jgi:leucine dehydrogenase
MARGGHDRVIAVHHEASGLRAWIALHHLGHGPAYGGIRVLNYRSEADALHDALRLSRAMTLKCVLAGVKGGGGKTIVMAEHMMDRSEAMKALGREIEALGGLYQTGPDAGFTAQDRIDLSSETSHAAQFFSSGELRSGGEATAEGADHGIRAALDFLGTPEVSDISIAIQGLGSVGMALAKRYLAAGARVFAADVNPEAATTAEEMGVEIVAPAKILEVSCDVLAPAALGGTVHDLSISRMNTRIVAGVANNVLGHAQQAELLRQRGILFLPDFVLNAGALIEGSGYSRTGREDWTEEIAGIGKTMREILERADAENKSTRIVAEQMAMERF